MRKLFFTGLALCIIGFAMTANAAVFNYADEEYRFTWTDSTGVEHSNLLTDKATDPDHILALIAKVYATPEIPGTIYSNEINKTGKINYDYHASQTEHITSSTPTKYLDWLKSYDKPISAPSENGKTVLFVEIKPTFHAKGGIWQGVDIKSNRDFVKYCYKSVQLLSSHMRVNDTNNPGYMFVVDNITTNRFFFISKGRARASAGNYPLWTSFEQVSPTRGSGATVTTGLADSLKNGSVYKAIHSCGSVPIMEQGHEFTITGNSELNAFSNLTLYMPDKRLGQDNSYSNFNPTYAPRTFLYLCTLDADVKPSENHDGYFTISLKWSTNFNTAKIGAQAEEQFYVYVVNDDGTYTLLHESDATMQTPTQTRTHTYEVPQEADSRIIRYIVAANPIEKSGNDVNASSIFIYSNVDQVQIPGRQAFFSQASEYRSRFDISSQLNVYKNTISIKPNTQGDYEKIETTQAYSMMRRHTDADGNIQEIAIANLKFNKAENGTYSYTLKYNADAQNTDVKYDDNAPSTAEGISGTLTSNDGVIYFYDYFNASTASNDQPSQYNYVLQLDGVQTSNSGTVPVYKTTASSHLVSVTKDQVAGDSNRGLDATEGGLAVDFKGYIDADHHIKRYDVYRLDSDPVIVGNAQCENGYITLIKGNRQIGDPQQPGLEGYTFSLPDELSSSQSTPAIYVPVITTNVTFAGATVTNTYGCSRTAVDAPNLELKVDNLLVSASKWVDANGHKRCGYGATVHLTPTLPETTAPYAYYYRVWRLAADDETQLNSLPSSSNTGWENDYEDIKPFYPGNDEIQVKDVYVANMPNADESRIVTYIARLYSTDQAQSHPAVPLKAASASGTAAGHYYITEKRIDVDYSSPAVATGIDGITTVQATPVSEVYYNVMGVASTRPHPGMNVVVTTLSDGSRLTTKMMK